MSSLKIMLSNKSFSKAELVNSAVVLLGALALCFGSLTEAAQPKVSSYLLKDFTPSQVQVIAQRFEVKLLPTKLSRTQSASPVFQAFVSELDLKSFLQLAPRAQLLEDDTSRESHNAFAAGRALSGLSASGYHSLDEVQKLMAQMAAAHPNIAQLTQYGLSNQKRPLLVLRVSNHLSDGKKVPRVMLTAATHGDEIITTEILLSLINTFLSGSGQIPQFENLLEKLEVDFIPVVNPDGFAVQNRYDNGQDPNRSFPFPKQPQAQPTMSTQGVMSFVKQYPIAGSIDFHAYGRLVMYPWGYTHDSIPAQDKAAFEAVTSRMAATNGSQHGPIADIIYVAQGSSADYYYWKTGALSLGIEVGDSKAPNASQIPLYVKDQAESTWIFLDSFK